jgi:hypothetical protein
MSQMREKILDAMRKLGGESTEGISIYEIGNEVWETPQILKPYLKDLCKENEITKVPTSPDACCRYRFLDALERMIKKAIEKENHRGGNL